MAFVLVFVGLLMVITGFKGTYAAFGQQLAADFTGDHNFTYWVAAIIGVGAVGYINPLRVVSRLFLTLILISMILANKGFFAKLTAALKQGPVAPTSGTGSVATNQASSATGSSNFGIAGANGQSLKQSLTQPGGGGFWSYFGIPSPFGG